MSLPKCSATTPAYSLLVSFDLTSHVAPSATRGWRPREGTASSWQALKHQLPVTPWNGSGLVYWTWPVITGFIGLASSLRGLLGSGEYEITDYWLPITGYQLQANPLIN